MIPNESSKRTGNFSFVAVLDRLGQRLAEPIPYSVGYVYTAPDLDAVQYLRIVDDHGQEIDKSEIHGSSLFHAFKAHVEAAK
ncbi:MAG: hypothetical protein ACI9R3_002839 [Verrucomicrobiales bacterium]|jgi:hypothetical protein